MVMGRAGRAGRVRELFGEKAEAALDVPDKYLPTAEASPVMPPSARSTVPMSGPAALACDGISIMSNGDTPIIWSSDGERLGITEGGDADVVVANRLLATLTGKPLVQFRMGYAMHLEVGDAHEVTIETTFEVVDGNSHWGGEPLTAEAAARYPSLSNSPETQELTKPL